MSSRVPEGFAGSHDPQEIKPENKPDYNKFARAAAEKNKDLSPAEREILTPRVVVSEVPGEVCQPIMAQVEAAIDTLAIEVSREANGQILKYQVIDGIKVREHLPDLWKLGEKFLPYAESLYGSELVLLDDDEAAININIVPEQGEQGVHVDRNEVTLCLYISEPEGGELEVMSGDTPGPIPVHAGRMAAIVRANELFHRVRPVLAPTPGKDAKRKTIVFAYGLPGKHYHDVRRDYFLYKNDIPVVDQQIF